jgi:hypothetical protein
MRVVGVFFLLSKIHGLFSEAGWLAGVPEICLEMKERTAR